VKRLENGSIEKFKCRLVANGNTQVRGVDFDQVFSTVAKISTIRILLIIATAYDLNLTSIDVVKAYLQAVLTEDLYMMVPPGLSRFDGDGKPQVVKLKKSLYGLRQAGRRWNELFTSKVTAWGFKQSAIDTCLFTYQRGKSIIWLLIWVDDGVLADNDSSLRDQFVSYLNDQFTVEDKGALSWVLQVGIERDRSSKVLTMSQSLYIRDLASKYAWATEGLTKRFDSPFDSNAKLSAEQCPTEGSAEHKQMAHYRDTYMSLVGAYLWLSNVSRYDITYIAGHLAKFVSNPGMAHYRAALRVLIYLNGTADRVLTFRPQQSRPLCAYVDSDWSTKFSISGGMIELFGCPAHWFSRTQRSVSMSSTEAEYFAACVMTREVIFMRDLVCDFDVAISGPTVIRTDNKGVVDLSFDPVAFKKTKHILRAAEFVRDQVLRLVVSFVWIAGVNNVADLFTKPVALSVFRHLLKLAANLSMI
jgi:hypothetical protein